MKKRAFNSADVIIIVLAVLAVASVIARLIYIRNVSTVQSAEYVIGFTASPGEDVTGAMSAGDVVTDVDGGSFTLAEGYWISGGDVTGRLFAYGRMTENGFYSNGTYYKEGGELTLTYGKNTFTAHITYIEKGE